MIEPARVFRPTCPNGHDLEIYWPDDYQLPTTLLEIGCHCGAKVQIGAEDLHGKGAADPHCVKNGWG